MNPELLNIIVAICLVILVLSVVYTFYYLVLVLKSLKLFLDRLNEMGEDILEIKNVLKSTTTKFLLALAGSFIKKKGR